jgi:hypothetical protein
VIKLQLFQLVLGRFEVEQELLWTSQCSTLVTRPSEAGLTYFNQLILLIVEFSESLIAFSESRLRSKITDRAVSECSISRTKVWAAVQERMIEGWGERIVASHEGHLQLISEIKWIV